MVENVNERGKSTVSQTKNVSLVLNWIICLDCQCQSKNTKYVVCVFLRWILLLW